MARTVTSKIHKRPAQTRKLARTPSAALSLRRGCAPSRELMRKVYARRATSPPPPVKTKASIAAAFAAEMDETDASEPEPEPEAEAEAPAAAPAADGDAVTIAHRLEAVGRLLARAFGIVPFPAFVNAPSASASTVPTLAHDTAILRNLAPAHLRDVNINAINRAADPRPSEVQCEVNISRASAAFGALAGVDVSINARTGVLTVSPHLVTPTVARPVQHYRMLLMPIGAEVAEHLHAPVAVDFEHRSVFDATVHPPSADALARGAEAVESVVRYTAGAPMAVSFPRRL